MFGKKKIKPNTPPTTEQLEQELYREKYKNRYLKILRSTFYALIVVAALSVLVATILLPVFQIYGTSMKPTLTEGDIVFSIKAKQFKRGDIVAFYYNNRILVKRVIALPGETVTIYSNGDVYVSGVYLEEPYIKAKNAGETDIEYPYTVPENSYFVLGDHRNTSIDSRNSAIGCIDGEEIVGKILFTVWPFAHFGTVE